MKPPAIRYTRTPDGFNIAFTALGEGPVLVYLQPFTHQQLDWEVAELRDWVGALAADRQVFRYDARGFGLSDRAPESLTLDAMVADLSAIVDASGAAAVDLMGISGLGLPAIAFAAAQPDRVRRLVLWGAVARGSGLFDSPGAKRVRAVEALFDIDTDLVRELVARLLFGEDAMQHPECRAHVAESIDVPQLRAYTEALRSTDVSPLLPRVRCPTLLMLPRSRSLASAEDIRAMATALPACELSNCDGEIYPHRGPDPSERLRILTDFLEARPARGAAASGPAAVLTPREIDVLDRLARGSANQEIAHALGLSVRTVERHVTNLYRKIDARGRTDATVYALTHGLGGMEDAGPRGPYPSARAKSTDTPRDAKRP